MFARNAGLLPAVVGEGEISGTEIYLRCDDLGESMSALTAAGARLLSDRAPRDWGDEAAYFADPDPDGNVIVVSVPLVATGD